MTLADGIRAIYAQVDAPGWAAANLDALVDILRDLSWLPDGAVEIVLPPLADDDIARLQATVAVAAAETADGPHPVRLIAP